MGGVLGNWERVERVVAYASSGRARYPSMAQAADGSLLILFTQQTPEQEAAGRGDLLLIRSGDGGKNWRQPEVIYRSQAGEPRAVGTLSRLAAGRLIAPFAVLDAAAATSEIGLLQSDDDGRTWSVIEPQIESPLQWLAPTGRVVEQADGTLVMSVHGADSVAALQETVHGCGLLRSDDGGKTWGRYSWIVRGNCPISGAWPESQYSFEAPAVQPLTTTSDGRWLAVVTARRLGDGPGAPQVLCRLWSEDAGQSWNKPDQLIVGAWAGLAVVGEYTIVCPFAAWAAWGDMRIVFSDDGLASFHQQLELMTWGWMKGMNARMEEAPLPPTVPFMGDNWPYEFFGFPSTWAVDEDRIAVALSRTRAHSGYWHGAEKAIVAEGPEQTERIDVIFYERPAAARARGPIKDTAPPATGRWVLAERWELPYITMAAELPNGDLVTQEYGDDRRPRRFLRSSDSGRTWQPLRHANTIGNDVDHYRVVLGALRSGRWLGAVARELSASSYAEPRRAVQRGGYPVFGVGGCHYDLEFRVYYSDDEGRTWQGGDQVVRKPLVWAVPYGRFLELPDGEVLLTGYGVEQAEAVDYYGSSAVLFRSQDAGRTWGEMSVIMPGGSHARSDEPQPNPRHNEVAVQPLPDGTLLAASRTEFFAQGPRGGILPYMCRSISTDGGQTWSHPEPKLGSTQGQGQLLALPGGGVAFISRTTSWQNAGVYISYDLGRTFRYALTSTYAVTSAFVRGTDELVVLSYKWGAGCTPYGAAYRWIETGQ